MAIPARDRDEAREQLSDHELRLQRIEEIVGRTEGAVHDLGVRVGKVEHRLDEMESILNNHTNALESVARSLRAIGDHLGVKFPPSKLD